MWVCGLKADCPANCSYQLCLERTVECTQDPLGVACPYREVEAEAQSVPDSAQQAHAASEQHQQQ